LVLARRAKVIIQPYNGHFPLWNGHLTTIQWSFPNGKWSSYNYTMVISQREMVIIQLYNGHFPTENGHHTTIQWPFRTVFFAISCLWCRGREPVTSPL